MSEQKKIILDSFDFYINCDDDKLILQVKNTVTLDEYYINFEDNEEVKKIAIFIHDISILKTFLLEQFDEYTKDDEHKTTDIIMSIEETKQNLILHFATNEHIKYMKTSFNIILNKCAVSFDEYIKNTFTILNDTIKKLDDRVNFLENENKQLIKIINHVDSKTGNHIIINSKIISFDIDDMGIKSEFVGICYNLSQDELQSLNRLSKLKSIYIHNNQITSLNFINDCELLENVWLTCCNNLTDISSLLNKRHINTINIDRCPHIIDVSPLSTISSLKILVLHNTRIIDFTAFKNNQSLKILNGNENDTRTQRLN